MRFSTRFAALIACLAGWGCALAGDAVTDAVQSAYGPYRTALFRTNSNSQPEAAQAIAQAQQAWKSVSDRFGANPPVPYDRDPQFSRTLAQVAAVYAKAATEVAAGKLAPAHETLEDARDLIAAMRQRNGVVVFSDHMNAYHAQMEHVLMQGPKQLASAQGMPELVGQLGVLDYLARQLRAQAPESLRQNAEFDTLLKDVEASVSAAYKAGLAQDANALKGAIGKLKVPYSKLFLKFG